MLRHGRTGGKRVGGFDGVEISRNAYLRKLLIEVPEPRCDSYPSQQRHRPYEQGHEALGA